MKIKPSTVFDLILIAKTEADLQTVAEPQTGYAVYVESCRNLAVYNGMEWVWWNQRENIPEADL